VTTPFVTPAFVSGADGPRTAAAANSKSPRPLRTEMLRRRLRPGIPNNQSDKKRGFRLRTECAAGARDR